MYSQCINCYEEAKESKLDVIMAYVNSWKPASKYEDFSFAMLKGSDFMINKQTEQKNFYISAGSPKTAMKMLHHPRVLNDLKDEIP